MNKKKPVLAIGLVALITVSGFVAVQVFRASAENIGLVPSPVLYAYVVKWICNAPFLVTAKFQPGEAESIGLVPGEYMTDINVHNPSFSQSPLTVVKKIERSVPEAPSVKLTIAAKVATKMGPDASFFMNCSEIYKVLQISGAAKGFVIIVANTDKLDVVAEYSQIGHDCVPFNLTICNPVGSSLDVERIPARLFVP